MNTFTNWILRVSVTLLTLLIDYNGSANTAAGIYSVSWAPGIVLSALQIQTHCYQQPYDVGNITTPML